MGFPTKVQLIRRQTSEQWYINFPSAVAQAMEFEKGGTVEWFIEDKETLVLERPEAPARKLKKKLPDRSSRKSNSSSESAGAPAGRSGAGNGGAGSR